MRVKDKDSFQESSLRAVATSIIKALEQTPNPELVDRALNVLREIRKPALDELSAVIEEFRKRIEEVEAVLDLVKRANGIREPVPRRAVGPAGVLNR